MHVACVIRFTCRNSKKYPAAIRQPLAIFNPINILDLFAIFCGVKPTSSFHIKLRPAFCPSFLRLCFVESQARTTLQQSFAHRYRGSNAICRTKAVNFQSYTINWVDTPCVVASLTDKLWNQFRKKAPYQHTARIKGKTKQYKQ